MNMARFYRLRDCDCGRSLRILASTKVDSRSRKALVDAGATANRANELTAIPLSTVVLVRSKPTLKEMPLITSKIKNPHGTTNTSR
jgi:hypothetical protein